MNQRQLVIFKSFLGDSDKAKAENDGYRLFVLIVSKVEILFQMAESHWTVEDIIEFSLQLLEWIL